MNFLRGFGRYFVLSLALIATCSSAGETIVHISEADGSRGSLPLSSIAVFPFSSQQPSVIDLAEIISNDLARSGIFRPVPRADLLQLLSRKSSGIDVLQSAGIRYAVTGALAEHYIRFYLWDVSAGAVVMGFDVPFNRTDQLRYVAHQISDLIHERVTQIPGIANTKIVYVSREGVGSSASFRLIVSDADGENPRVVAQSREVLLTPAWSPDRTQISYVGFERGQSAVYIQTLANGVVRKIVSEKGINGSPAWSPDSRYLAVTLSVDGSPDIYIVDAINGSRRRLTDSPGIDTEAAWSSDGRSIAFVSDRGGFPQVYSTPSDGGSATLLSPAGQQSFRPSYSLDGRHLAFVVREKSGYKIALSDLSTGGYTLMSEGPSDQSPSFSPNGRAIVYSSSSGAESALRSVAIDGGVRMTMKGAGDVSEPAWSPFVPAPERRVAPPRTKIEADI